MRVRGSVSTRPSAGSRVARLAVVAALVVGAAVVTPGTGRVALAGADGPVATGPGAAGPGASGAAAPAGTRLTDQVVIRWATTTRTPRLLAARVAALGSQDRLDAVSTAAGPDVHFVRALGSDGSSGVYQLGAPLGADAPATLAAIAALPGVDAAEPDVWVTADALPDDPYAAQLWGMLGAANGSPYGTNVLPAWATTRGEGVTVAVIDTGILAHPDLAGQTVAGYDMISDAQVANDGGGRDANPSDPGDWVTAGDVAGAFEGCPVEGSSWHGTHVAGTIAGIEGNAAGVFGAAPDARIQAIRVLGKCGGYLSDISDGIVWAAGGSVPGVPANATPADVLNLSLGGAATCQSYTASAIATARSLGAVVVVAAGNEGYDVSLATPANCPGSFVVAATTSAGAKASFSNYGAIVDIAGPGVGIWSTLNAGTTVPAAMGYAQYSGTSMATPHVAATAALLAAADPGATNDEIEAAIKAGATAFPAACTGCGAGIAHVPGALEELVGQLPTPTPTAAPTSTPSASPPTATPVPTPTAPLPTDVTPPVAIAPSVEPRTGSRMSGTSIPLSVRWNGADEPGGSGIDHFDVARSTDGGTTWTLLSDTATGTSMSTTTASSGTVRFRVRAVDVAGNIGGWSTGPRLAPALVQQGSSAVRWSGTWRRVGASAYSGGSARYATARWAKSTYTFRGRGIALVSTRAKTRGRASIYIDGAYAGAVDMGVGSTQYRTVAWRKTWAASGSHSIRVVVVRTGGRPRVDVDAFVVIR